MGQNIGVILGQEVQCQSARWLDVRTATRSDSLSLFVTLMSLQNLNGGQPQFCSEEGWTANLSLVHQKDR